MGLGEVWEGSDGVGEPDLGFGKISNWPPHHLVSRSRPKLTSFNVKSLIPFSLVSSIWWRYTEALSNEMSINRNMIHWLLKLDFQWGMKPSHSFGDFSVFWVMWCFGFQTYPVDIIHIQASLIYGTAINLQKSIYHPYSLKRVYTTTSILVPLMVLQLFRVLAAGWSGGAWWRAVLTHPNWSASSLDTPTPSQHCTSSSTSKASSCRCWSIQNL